MSILDRLATWWLIRRGKLIDLKPRLMSEEEAEKVLEEWKRKL